MSAILDMQALLAPIAGDDPAGEDLYYSSVHDEIKEARRSDGGVALGEWERELKTSDWGKVIESATLALTTRSKDLQVAVWLTEALTVTRGFAGLEAGMQLMHSLLTDYWDGVYPRLEGEDFDYRAAPLHFLNDAVSATVRQIPLTDPRQTPGYGLFEWQQSRKVGYESERKGERAELMADGHPSPEDFDQAVAKSSAPFYKALAESITAALATLRTLEAEADARFGKHPPNLGTLGSVLEECSRLVLKICREQKGLREALDGEGGEKAAPEASASAIQAETATAAIAEALQQAAPAAADPAPLFPAPHSGGGESREGALWNEALAVMQGRGFKEALDILLCAASSQSSERGRCRYRFLVAKLCLKAGRPELARPIVEQLNTMIAELQLEKWECPFWISEIYEALYQCLLAGEGYEEETSRANELFRKICTMDVTKALGSRI